MQKLIILLLPLAAYAGFAAGLGFADVEDGIPATADTPYDIASVAKPISAVVALRLVEAGVLDLARFDVALDAGLLISAESRTGMMTPTRTNDGKAAPYGLGWYVQVYGGHALVWHSGWWEDAYSALYLKIPALNLTFIVLANSEGIWWGNPLDQAAVERSQFAQAFLSAFVDM
jgi:CubicO group peptidase (beta-lactamase class C family)